MAWSWLPFPLLSCFLLFSSMLHSSTALDFSFDFSNMGSYDPSELLLEESAGINGPLISLTPWLQPPRLYTAGRVSYSRPVPLRRPGSRDVASFTTRFSFLINNHGFHLRGDGITFFISKYPANIDSGATGQNLGLFPGGKNTSGDGSILAVEFDTDYNVGVDPTEAAVIFDHIGINLNSIRSDSYTVLPVRGTLSSPMEAVISYRSQMQTLDVTLHTMSGTYYLTRTQLDLTAALPFVNASVGISASTGRGYQYNELLHWSFSSTIGSGGVGDDGGGEIAMPAFD